MQLRSAITLLLVIFFLCVKGQQGKKFERAAFYKAMQTGTLVVLDAQMAALDGISAEEKEAFEGALLMKKADLAPKAKEKLRLFKAGRLKLEGSIKKAPANGEYRFLRLMIQENAPGILGYNKDKGEDKDQILKSYKSMPEITRQAIADYSQKSKTLKPADL